jgi:predicted transcriptional regulator
VQSPKDPETEIALVLTALANPVRRSILQDLDTWVPATMAYLREELPQSRQAILKHLDVMKKAGIVIRSGRGLAAEYYIDPRPIRRVLARLGRRYKRDRRPLSNLYRFGSPYSPFD